MTSNLSRRPTAAFVSTRSPEKSARVLTEVDDIQAWRNGGITKADVGNNSFVHFAATASSHCPGSSPANLVDANDAMIGHSDSGAFGKGRTRAREARKGTRTDGWLTATRGSAWLLIELTRKCVVNEVVVLNHATSRVTVAIGLNAKASAFVDVRTDVLLAHRKETRIACGSLPCKFIKLKCHRGAPVGIASIRVRGVPVGNPNMAGKHEDSHHTRSAQQHTEAVIYGRSLRATRETYLSPHSDLSFRRSPSASLGRGRPAAAAAAAEEEEEGGAAFAGRSALPMPMPPAPPQLLRRSVDSFARSSGSGSLGRTFASAGPPPPQQRDASAVELAAELSAAALAGGLMDAIEREDGLGSAAAEAESLARALDQMNSFALEGGDATLGTTQSSGATQGGGGAARR
jgi:hypothetical protein